MNEDSVQIKRKKKTLHCNSLSPKPFQEDLGPQSSPERTKPAPPFQLSSLPADAPYASQVHSGKVCSEDAFEVYWTTPIIGYAVSCLALWSLFVKKLLFMNEPGTNSCGISQNYLEHLLTLNSHHTDFRSSYFLTPHGLPTSRDPRCSSRPPTPAVFNPSPPR